MELESQLSEVLQYKHTSNPPVCIFQDMAYGGVSERPNWLDEKTYMQMIWTLEMTVCASGSGQG